MWACDAPILPTVEQEMQSVIVYRRGGGWHQMHASPDNSDADKVLTASASLLVFRARLP